MSRFIWGIFQQREKSIASGIFSPFPWSKQRNLILVLLRMNIFSLFSFFLYLPFSKLGKEATTKSLYTSEDMNIWLHLSVINIYTDTSSCSSKTGRYFKITWFIPAYSEVSGNTTVDPIRLSGICGSSLWAALNWHWVTCVGAGAVLVHSTGSTSEELELWSGLSLKIANHVKRLLLICVRCIICMSSHYFCGVWALTNLWVWRCDAEFLYQAPWCFLLVYGFL